MPLQSIESIIVTSLKQLPLRKIAKPLLGFVLVAGAVSGTVVAANAEEPPQRIVEPAPTEINVALAEQHEWAEHITSMQREEKYRVLGLLSQHDSLAQSEKFIADDYRRTVVVKQRIEQERIAAEKAEAARLEAERLAAEKKAAEEAARQEAQRLEAERLKAEELARQEQQAEVERKAQEEAKEAAEKAREIIETSSRSEPTVSRSNDRSNNTGDDSYEVVAAVPSGSAKSIAAEMVSARGWSNDQFTCLEKLWQKESGWKHTAENPSSGAYGIPQSLPGSKMASAGSDWRTNPATQITWGLDYISGRYGDPCGAWSHSQSKNWY